MICCNFVQADDVEVGQVRSLKTSKNDSLNGSASNPAVAVQIKPDARMGGIEIDRPPLRKCRRRHAG